MPAMEVRSYLLSQNTISKSAPACNELVLVSPRQIHVPHCGVAASVNHWPRVEWANWRRIIRDETQIGNSMYSKCSWLIPKHIMSWYESWSMSWVDRFFRYVFFYWKNLANLSLDPFQQVQLTSHPQMQLTSHARRRRGNWPTATKRMVFLGATVLGAPSMVVWNQQGRGWGQMWTHEQSSQKQWYGMVWPRTSKHKQTNVGLILIYKSKMKKTCLQTSLMHALFAVNSE